jgi:putative flippase GtrA
MEAFEQVLRYVLVGGGVTLADTALFLALTGGRCRIPSVPANLISTTFGMALGFSLHFLLVFRPEEALVPVRVARYLAIVVISVYGVQSLVIFALESVWRGPTRLVKGATACLVVDGADWGGSADRLFCKCAAAGAGVVWNYFGFKHFVYA